MTQNILEIPPKKYIGDFLLNEIVFDMIKLKT